MAKAKSSTSKDKSKRPAAKAAASTAAVETKVTRVSVASSKSSTARKRISQELVIGSLFAELLGTFALTSFILAISSLSGGGNPLMIGLTIAGLYLVFARLSGGQLNPAITLGLMALKKISLLKGAGYIVAQFAGAAGGFVVVNQFVQAYPSNETTGQVLTLFQATLADADHWRPFFAEALGALFIGFALAAIVLNRKNETEGSLAIGLAFLGGLTVALLGSAGILNPAVALSLGAYQIDNFWTILQYALGPVAGVVVGALAYKLLKWDITGGKAED